MSNLNLLARVVDEAVTRLEGSEVSGKGLAKSVKSKKEKSKKAAKPEVAKVAHVVKPKRRLTAYNFFFQDERAKLLGIEPPRDNRTPEVRKRRKHRKTHGKFGFTELTRIISEKWSKIDDKTRAHYLSKQEEDAKRYKDELALHRKYLYEKCKEARLERQSKTSESSSPRQESEKAATTETETENAVQQDDNRSPPTCPKEAPLSCKDQEPGQAAVEQARQDSSPIHDSMQSRMTKSSPATDDPARDTRTDDLLLPPQRRPEVLSSFNPFTGKSREAGRWPGPEMPVHYPRGVGPMGVYPGVPDVEAVRRDPRLCQLNEQLRLRSMYPRDHPMFMNREPRFGPWNGPLQQPPPNLQVDDPSQQVMYTVAWVPVYQPVVQRSSGSGSSSGTTGQTAPKKT